MAFSYQFTFKKRPIDSVMPDKVSNANADPVSSANVKDEVFVYSYQKNREQNASRFGIYAGSRRGACFAALVRDDDEIRIFLKVNWYQCKRRKKGILSK